jgi:hypothetical protein
MENYGKRKRGSKEAPGPHQYIGARPEFWWRGRLFADGHGSNYVSENLFEDRQVCVSTKKQAVSAMRKAILLAFILAACAPQTFDETQLRSFNADFSSKNPVAPKYQISELADGLYRLVVHQGDVLWSEGNVRYSLLKDAALIITIKKCAGHLPSHFDDMKTGDSNWVHLTAFFKCADAEAKPSTKIEKLFEKDSNVNVR